MRESATTCHEQFLLGDNVFYHSQGKGQDVLGPSFVRVADNPLGGRAYTSVNRPLGQDEAH